MTSAGTVVARWQGEVSLPVDPSFFADATFTATLEEQVEKGGVIGVEVGVAEVRRGEGYEEEERSYLTSEEAVESPVAGERGRNRGRNRRGSGKKTAGAVADEEGRDRGEDEEIPTSDRKLLTSSELTDSLSKTEAAAEAEATAAAARAAAANAKSSANNMPSQTRQPSSRAQGKQPMNYAPPPTSTATATTTTTTATTTTTQRRQRPSRKLIPLLLQLALPPRRLQRHPLLILIHTHTLITIHRRPPQMLHNPETSTTISSSSILSNQ
ncbi:hypothetical protein EI94DRAFT_212661 [Lactarius quietus]|nr:hypothetical protein EI94DRAFT_212661 [Lactarius quietus]